MSGKPTLSTPELTSNRFQYSLNLYYPLKLCIRPLICRSLHSVFLFSLHVDTSRGHTLSWIHLLILLILLIPATCWLSWILVVRLSRSGLYIELRSLANFLCASLSLACSRTCKNFVARLSRSKSNPG
jgi:hypothetical protein